MEREEVKSLIEKTFEANVKGLIPDLSGFNRNHDGAEGDWLTKRMGLKVNGRNEPDFHGFEMKKDSRKTTFGDWAPDEALYKSVDRRTPATMSRSDFLHIFGSPKFSNEPRKNGRYSWSGEVFPTVKKMNSFGQILIVAKNNDIKALYNFHGDQRVNKNAIVPKAFQNDELELAKWEAQSLQNRLERKFNKFGWFKCVKDAEGRYDHVQFGYPINFEVFMKFVRAGEIFCDCGMYDGNNRPYMTWRASSKIWDSLQE